MELAIMSAVLKFEVQQSESLDDIIDSLDTYPEAMSFGRDIDAVHRVMFDGEPDRQGSQKAFADWVARYQPCLFGRLGAKGSKGVSYDMCWITSQDIRAGDAHVTSKIQGARRAWKDRAADGLSSGFLILFQDPRLARARPGRRLLDACQRAAELYIVESAPLQRETIYNEAIPLRRDGGYGLFRAGINVFYPGAHRTLNHDRRVPGGLLISVNSPGHLANSLVMRGVVPSLPEAVRWIYDIAMYSVGNGGIGHEKAKSCSWHNTTSDPEKLSARRELSHRPHYIPEDYNGKVYSAAYHSDVLLPTEATVKADLDPDMAKCKAWQWLVIDYISEGEVSRDHLNYGMFHPHPICPEARYDNPWPAREAHNHPLFEY
jgi:hypothetical protein